MKLSAPQCVRSIDALFERRGFALPLFALLAFAFTSPLYLRPMNLGHGDWLWFHFTWDSARKTYLDFNEVPWWNPYYCGGNLGVANPQGFSLSPLFLLLLPLPTALAMKVYLSTLTFFGQWGVYELCRRYYGRGAGAALAGVFYACSGYMGWHMNGQTGMANLHLLPWVMYFYLRGRERAPWALGAGGVLAFMLFTSGLYPCVISCVALLAHGLVVLFEGRWEQTFRSILSGAVAAASALAYAAVKLVPVADFLRDHARPIPKDDAIGLPVLIDALFVKRTTETQIWPHVGYMYAWWGEYGNYIGPLGVLLAAAGLWCARGRLRRERRLVVVFLGLVIGDHGSYSPYAVLRSLPMLGNLRVPTRYWIVVDLFVACLLSHGFWRVTRAAAARLRGPARAAALGAIAAVAAGFVLDVVQTNGVAVFRGAMPTPPAPLNVRGAEFHQVAGSSGDMYRYPPQNLGTLRCFDELSVEISPSLRPGLPSEAYLTDEGAGRVRVARWTPSSWGLSVDLERPATVVINQNAYRGWRASGAEVKSLDGLVAVDLPAGRRELTVYYRPVGYQVGVAISLASLALTAWLLASLRRRAAG